MEWIAHKYFIRGYENFAGFFSCWKFPHQSFHGELMVVFVSTIIAYTIPALFGKWTESVHTMPVRVR